MTSEGMRKVRVVVPRNARRGDYFIFGIDPTSAFLLGREIGEKLENLYPIPSSRVVPMEGEQVIGTIVFDERHMPNEIARDVLAIMENHDAIRDAWSHGL